MKACARPCEVELMVCDEVLATEKLTNRHHRVPATPTALASCCPQIAHGRGIV